MLRHKERSVGNRFLLVYTFAGLYLFTHSANGYRVAEGNYQHQGKPNWRVRLKEVRNTNPIFIQNFDVIHYTFLHFDFIKMLH